MICGNCLLARGSTQTDDVIFAPSSSALRIFAQPRGAPGASAAESAGADDASAASSSEVGDDADMPHRIHGDASTLSAFARRLSEIVSCLALRGASRRMCRTTTRTQMIRSCKALIVREMMSPRNALGALREGLL
eukprot:2194428-Pleurochrysis_carterae.AAC.2